MSDYPDPKFSLWFNCQREDGQDKYWAVSEISIEEISKIYAYACDEANTVDHESCEVVNLGVDIAATQFRVACESCEPLEKRRLPDLLHHPIHSAAIFRAVQKGPNPGAEQHGPHAAAAHALGDQPPGHVVRAAGRVTIY